MRTARRLALAFVVLLLVGGPPLGVPTAAAASGVGWTQFHYGATHAGYDPLETSLTAGNAGKLAVRWSAPLSADVIGGVAVGGGRVFGGTYDGNLVALRASDGGRLWRTHVGTWIGNVAPALSGSLVMIPANDARGGLLAGYDAASGARRWMTRLGGDVAASSPAVYGDTAYISNGGTVFAIRVATGTIRWRTTVGTNPDYDSTSGPVAVSGYGELVVGASIDGRVYALDAGTGRVRWLVKAGGGTYQGGPSISKGIVYVPEGATSSEGGGFSIVALQVSDGRRLWRSLAGDDVHSTPAAANGLVFSGAIDGSYRALDAATGAVRWAIDAGGGEVWGSPAVANGVLYLTTESGLQAREASSGRLLYRFGTSPGVACMASPVVWAGRLYLGYGDSRMVALGLR